MKLTTISDGIYYRIDDSMGQRIGEVWLVGSRPRFEAKVVMNGVSGMAKAQKPLMAAKMAVASIKRRLTNG